jgi:hypothetical protein
LTRKLFVSLCVFRAASMAEMPDLYGLRLYDELLTTVSTDFRRSNSSVSFSKTESSNVSFK